MPALTDLAYAASIVFPVVALAAVVWLYRDEVWRDFFGDDEES